MVERIDISDGQEPEYNHPPFTGSRLDDIKYIKAVFNTVYPLSLDEWQYNFWHAANPDAELDWWLRLSQIYYDYSEGLSPDECKQAFEHLLQLNPKDTTAYSEITADD